MFALMEFCSIFAFRYYILFLVRVLFEVKYSSFCLISKCEWRILLILKFKVNCKIPGWTGSHRTAPWRRASDAGAERRGGRGSRSSGRGPRRRDASADVLLSTQSTPQRQRFCGSTRRFESDVHQRQVWGWRRRQARPWRRPGWRRRRQEPWRHPAANDRWGNQRSRFKCIILHFPHFSTLTAFIYAFHSV